MWDAPADLTAGSLISRCEDRSPSDIEGRLGGCGREGGGGRTYYRGAGKVPPECS